MCIRDSPYSMGGNITSVVIENDMQDEVSEEVQAPADPNACLLYTSYRRA